jgi:hypothetical protein
VCAVHHAASDEKGVTAFAIHKRWLRFLFSEVGPTVGMADLASFNSAHEFMNRVI